MRLVKKGRRLARRTFNAALALNPRVEWLYDRWAIKRKHLRFFGQIDLDHPTTYYDKIARKILYDTNPLSAIVADKVAVREYIASKVGSEFCRK